MIKEDIKKIPLHSLVIVFGIDNIEKTKIINTIFKKYEIISYFGIMENILGSVTRFDLKREIWSEIKRQIQLKLKHGERVILDVNDLKIKERQEIARIAERYTAPVFYLILGKETNIESKNIEKQILSGDGLAEVIDGRLYNIKAVEKLPYGNITSSIKDREYKGITVIPDIHAVYTALRSARTWATARGHFMVFLGDIVDFGPKPQECIDEIYDIVMNGEGCLIYGNHERKIEKWLQQDRIGNIRINLSDGNKVTIDIIQKLSRFDREKFENRYMALMAHARHHFTIDNIVLAHAGVHPDMYNNTEHRLNVREYANLAMFGLIDEKNPRTKTGDLNRVYTWCDHIPNGLIAIVGHDIRSTTKPMTVVNSNAGESIFMDTGSGKSGILTTADLKWDKKDGQLKISNFKRH